MSKKYCWLKLKDNFFNQKEIKKLRKIAGGDTFTIIYLKMQLLSVKNGGILKFDGTETNLAEQLALEIDEDVDNIALTLSFLDSNKLIETLNDDTFLLPRAAENIGTESESAERVRRHRLKKQLALSGNSNGDSLRVTNSNVTDNENFVTDDENFVTGNKIQAYSNAKRQKMYRAKKNCEKMQYISMIEDIDNKKIYNGNYYIVLQRDKYKCVTCNEIHDLHVHKIENRNGTVTDTVTENCNENQFITLCKKCKNKIDAGIEIDENVLISIGYRVLEEEEDRNVTLQSNVTVTNSNTEKDIDKEKEIYKEMCNEIWSAYPVKKGKAIAFKKLPNLLKKYSKEVLIQCIERYKAEFKNNDYTYMCHGSKFFNGKFEDYLDENYMEIQKTTKEPKKVNFEDYIV